MKDAVVIVIERNGKFLLIKRAKKGADVPTLIKKTGFEDKKIRNIVFRAFKQGKIKKVGRGIYAVA